MVESHSKSAFLHGQIRRALQSGRYVPGERIDPGALSDEFGISTTPIRLALYQLVGEGLLEDHARAGLRVPLPSEVALRGLYDWMERLLLMACEIGVAEITRRTGQVAPVPADGDVVKQTWKLFDAIADATAHGPLQQAVRQANDRLAPIRRAKKDLIDDTAHELDELNRYWHTQDIPALKSGLRAYHARRKRLVPCIVALLIEASRRLH